MMEITYEIYLSATDNIFEDPNALCFENMSQEEVDYITKIALRNGFDVAIRPLAKE